MKKVLFAAICAAAFTLGAEEVVLSKAKKFFPLSRKVRIDASKNYTLTVKTKGGKGKLLLCFFQYNETQRRIGAAQVWGNADSVTELVGPAIRGAKEFVVKDASKWKKPSSGSATNIVAFNAKADGSDLPNFTIDYYIKAITKMPDGTWKIEMRTPLRRSCRSGALVRQHYDGGHLSVTAPLPSDKVFSAQIKAAKGLGPNVGAWWPGTKFIQLSAMTTGDEPVTVTEWSLKETAAK